MTFVQINAFQKLIFLTNRLLSYGHYFEKWNYTINNFEFKIKIFFIEYILSPILHYFHKFMFYDTIDRSIDTITKIFNLLS